MQRLSHLIYVGDPMCSWCWGFAPEFEQLRRRLEGTVEVSLCMGNLRNGHPWDRAFRDYLKMQWRSVAETTGQPFDPSLPEQEYFDYTTEPACRAVCTGRELDGTLTFGLFSALQKAFYAEGRDITDPRVIGEIADAAGYDAVRFRECFTSAAMHDRVASDRARARAYGAVSFPSLVLIDAEGHLSVLQGYRRYEELLKLIGV